MSTETGEPFVIRAATFSDSAGCAYVHHTSWLETYSALVRAAHWQSDTLARREDAWQRWLDDGAVVTVAQAHGRVVGFASPGRGGRSVTISRCATASSARCTSSGHTAGLASAKRCSTPCRPHARRRSSGSPRATRARRYYERNGFAADGARFVDDSARLAEARHVR